MEPWGEKVQGMQSNSLSSKSLIFVLDTIPSRDTMEISGNCLG